jgi:hypothetical protein
MPAILGALHVNATRVGIDEHHETGTAVPNPQFFDETDNVYPEFFPGVSDTFLNSTV